MNNKLLDFGFVKVAAASFDTKVGDMVYNADEIIKQIERANSAGVDVVVLPELCLQGATLGDMLGQQTIINSSRRFIAHIAKQTQHCVTIAVFGSVVEADGLLFSAAVVVQNGAVCAIVPKTNLSNQEYYDERRIFASAIERLSNTVTIEGATVPFGNDLLFSLGSKAQFNIELGNDLFSTENTKITAQSDFTLNLAAHVNVIGRQEIIASFVKQKSFNAGYIYASASHTESTTHCVLSNQKLIAESGKLLVSSCDDFAVSHIDIEKIRYNKKHFASACPTAWAHESVRTVALERSCMLSSELCYPLRRNPFVPHTETEKKQRMLAIFDIQTKGLMKRLQHLNCPKALIGISGGLDSTLALLVTVNAFDRLGIDRKNILGITMPGFGSSNRTKNNATLLMTQLGIGSQTISIVKATEQHFIDINQSKEVHDVTYENAQARERTQILFDMANKEGGIVVGTGDLSELALGWCTYNGDHISNYCVNGDIPKTVVQHLVKVLAEQYPAEIKQTLLDIVDTPISPELLPTNSQGEIAQITEDKIGPYALHDFFLYYMIRYGFSPQKIYFLAVNAFGKKENESDVIYSKELIKKTLRTLYQRFFAQQFKRNCLVDGPKVGSVSISSHFDLYLPSDAIAKVWLNEIDEIDETN